jgi:hypothetical protein
MRKLTLLSGIFSLTFLLFLSSCKKEDAPFLGNPGDLISYELIDSLGIAEIDSIRTSTLINFLSDASIKGDQYENRFSLPQNPVKLYKVTYRSVVPESGNKPTIATGLIAIPVISSNNLPMISYQHGTVFDKLMVPSVYRYSDETKFMVLQFASQGYAMIAADYFGLGNTSTEPNSYAVRNSTEQACLDMYKASQKVLEDLNITMSKFFINGWSQGAYNTMLFLRRLERENIDVKACFTAAAPVDSKLFITRMLFNRRPFDAVYTTAVLTNLMFAIEKYNKLEGVTSRYIKSDYYNSAKDFYDFKINFFEYLDTVPSNLDTVFTAEFFQDARNPNTEFWNILERSEAYRWLSPTPLRAYYGLLDEAVPETNARLAVDYMTLLGKTDAQAINAGTFADHRNTYIESLIDAKSWIDSF